MYEANLSIWVFRCSLYAFQTRFSLYQYACERLYEHTGRISAILKFLANKFGGNQVEKKNPTLYDQQQKSIQNSERFNENACNKFVFGRVERKKNRWNSCLLCCDCNVCPLIWNHFETQLYFEFFVVTIYIWKNFQFTAQFMLQTYQLLWNKCKKWPLRPIFSHVSSNALTFRFIILSTNTWKKSQQQNRKWRRSEEKMVKRAKANQTKKKPSYTEAATAEKSEKETGGESERWMEKSS